MPEIRLENIKKTFNEGEIVAVNDISLTLHDGDYIFLLGPSGCGKTTLLKMLSGLLKPTKGKIFLDGINVTDLPPQERGIAFIFQNFEIFPITVWENCIYSLKVRGYKKDYIIREGQRALKLAGLEDRANEIPIGWSNGDLQRIGLARAICSGAKILIMDEPLGSLDPKVNREFRWELRRIIKESGLTAIQVTHDQDEAMSIGDRIVVMRDGLLLQENEQQVLYRNPNSIFVANFLGNINLREGYINHIDYPDTFTIKIRLGGSKHKIVSKKRFSLNENVIIIFRFENVYIFKKDYEYDKSRANWDGLVKSEATVLERHLTGKERIYFVELLNGDRIFIKKPETFQYDFIPGETIEIGLFDEDLLIFKYPDNLEHELALQ